MSTVLAIIVSLLLMMTSYGTDESSLLLYPLPYILYPLLYILHQLAHWAMTYTMHKPISSVATVCKRFITGWLE